jgi:hypothetical protein
MCCNSTIAVAELVGYRERKSFSFFILHSRLSLIKDSKNNTFANFQGSPVLTARGAVLSAFL